MPFLPIFVRRRGHAVSLIGSGGVVVGGSATIQVHQTAITRGDRAGLIGQPTPTYPTRRRLEPEPVLQAVALIGSGGVRVGGAAHMRSVSVRVAAYAAAGGLTLRGAADMRLVTPVRSANALILDLEAHEAAVDAAA